jgi:anthraniloyl-CoA monooxygenase
VNIVCIGGGPAGLYFALLMKQRDPRHRITVVERNRPTTRSAGASSSPTRRSATCRRPTARRPSDPRRVQPLGRHRGQHPRPRDPLERPRLLRHRPQAPAQHPAGALRALGVELVFETDVRATSRTRTPTLSLRATASDSRIRNALRGRPTSPTSTCGTAASSGSARHKLFEAFTFAVRGDGARVVPGARVPLRRHHVDVHRRGAGSRMAARGGLDRMEKASRSPGASGCSPATSTAIA